MKAKITKVYNIAPEGHTVIRYEVGDIVEGMTAQKAIAGGCAEAINDKIEIEAKQPAPLETPKAPKVSKKSGKGKK